MTTSEKFHAPCPHGATGPFCGQCYEEGPYATIGALRAELDAARAREQALKAEADTFHMQYRITCDVESKAALVRAEQAEAREAKTREALKAVLPFVATQRMACGGMKCRESWCESCQGEDDAEVSAQAGREAHEMALAALAEGENR